MKPSKLIPIIVVAVIIVIAAVFLITPKNAPQPAATAAPAATQTASPTATPIPTEVPTAEPTETPVITAEPAKAEAVAEFNGQLDGSTWNIVMLKLGGVLYDPARLNADIPTLWRAELTFADGEMTITQNVADQVNVESYQYTQTGEELIIGGCEATWSVDGNKLTMSVAPSAREIELEAERIN